MRIALKVVGHNPDMPRQRHYCGLNQLHFNIASTYYLDLSFFFGLFISDYFFAGG
jgi:hypothetical protein